MTNFGSTSGLTGVIGAGVTFTNSGSPTSANKKVANLPGTTAVSDLYIADNAALQLSTWSVEGWFKFNQLPVAGKSPAIIGKGTGGTRNFSVHLNSDGSMWFGIRHSTNGATEQGATTDPNIVDSGKWYHLVFKIGRAHV